MPCDPGGDQGRVQLGNRRPDWRREPEKTWNPGRADGADESARAPGHADGGQ